MDFEDSDYLKLSGSLYTQNTEMQTRMERRREREVMILVDIHTKWSIATIFHDQKPECRHKQHKILYPHT